MAKTYALGSVGMLNTPGLLAWAMNGYKFKRDRPALLNVFTSGWPHDSDNPNNPTEEAFDQLLKGEIPFTVENNAVVFSA